MIIRSSFALAPHPVCHFSGRRKAFPVCTFNITIRRNITNAKSPSVKFRDLFHYFIRNDQMRNPSSHVRYFPFPFFSSPFDLLKASSSSSQHRRMFHLHASESSTFLRTIVRPSLSLISSGSNLIVAAPFICFRIS